MSEHDEAIEQYIDRVKDELAYLDEPKAPGAPRYGTIYNQSACLDCGAVIADKRAHDRFHSILNDHGGALAILVNTHLAAHIHDRYDVRERIEKRDRAAALTSEGDES